MFCPVTGRFTRFLIGQVVDQHKFHIFRLHGQAFKPGNQPQKAEDGRGQPNDESQTHMTAQRNKNPGKQVGIMRLIGMEPYTGRRRLGWCNGL